MPGTLQSYLTGTNILQPIQLPQDARIQAGNFGSNQTLVAGQVVWQNTAGAFVTVGTNITGVFGLNQYTLSTDTGGNVFYGGSTNGTTLNPPLPSSPYWMSGDFDTTALTGWGTSVATAMGARTLSNTNWVHIP